MSWPKSRCVFELLAYFVLLHHCRCVDPCTNYKTLSHDNRVLTPSSASTSAEECDHYLKPNWYRIDGNAASDLVNSCPDLGQCGTLFPVWLNGSTPSESDGIVDRIACKRGLSDAACCEKTINIKLKNCGLFRVAYLKPLSGCPGKYCFEFNELCPPGQTSNSGFKPCKGKSKALKNFGGGSGPIWFDDPECKGTETDIADCQRMFRTPVPIWGIKTCHHREDVGVRCESSSRKPIIIG